jgi:hypothetical protein
MLKADHISLLAIALVLNQYPLLTVEPYLFMVLKNKRSQLSAFCSIRAGDYQWQKKFTSPEKIMTIRSSLKNY